jgi:hypothetical protein
MITAVLGRDSFDANAMLAPFFCDEFATSIGGGFLKAGRFRNDEPAQRCEHLWESRVQDAQEFFEGTGIRHGWDMLTTPRNQSNPAESIR